MADTQSGCAKAALTIGIVLLGAIVGVVIGGLSGFFFGGVLGYVLLRQADLGRRLKSVEEAQRWVKGFSTPEPPAPLPPPSSPPAAASTSAASSGSRTGPFRSAFRYRTRCPRRSTASTSNSPAARTHRAASGRP